MSGIRKTFGPVVALDGVDFTVADREIHGLLGGNGAGKTTLMNVLYGLYAPDAGTVEIDGPAVDHRLARATRSPPGIGMVHQNFLQVDVFTVAENIVLGTDSHQGADRTSRRRPADRRAVRAVRPHGRPDRPRRRPARRGPPARRDPQGALPRRQDPRARRADDQPHPAGGRRPLLLDARHRRRRHVGRPHHPQDPRDHGGLRPHDGHARRPLDRHRRQGRHHRRRPRRDR